MIGIDLKNCTITPKKSPKRFTIPSDSIIKPKNVHFIKIIKAPTRKKSEPRLLFGLVKNMYVFCEPIIKNTPIKNKILPKANKARSNKVNTPNKKKRKPPKVKATPNSIKNE